MATSVYPTSFNLAWKKQAQTAPKKGCLACGPASGTAIELGPLCSTEYVLTTLKDTTKRLLRPITVHIEEIGGSFVATMTEASISTSGETRQEVLQNLGSYIAEVLDILLAERGNLGPGPYQQLLALGRYFDLS